MIKPTVGRIVWYRREGPKGSIEAAIVCGVNSDTSVNLAVFNMYGNLSLSDCNVHLKQEASEQPPAPYAEWMPYQVGQGQAADTKGGLMDRMASVERRLAALDHVSTGREQAEGV